MTTDELRLNLEMLRRMGVKSFVDVAGGGFSVEFFPAQPDAEPETKPVDHEVCRCGHMGYEHGPAGDCLKGCLATACAPEE